LRSLESDPKDTKNILLYLRWKASVVCFLGKRGRVMYNRRVRNEPNTPYRTTRTRSEGRKQESKKNMKIKKDQQKIQPFTPKIVFAHCCRPNVAWGILLL